MTAETVGSPLLWAGFAAFIVAMLALDLGVFNRKAHTISTKEAAIWSGVWILLALAFNAFVFLRWGAETGEAFLTGYLIEKALSVDNLFVFYMIFTAFGIADKYQHRLLFWGIAGALVLRAGMVFAGSYVLSRFHWAVYLFGLLLLATGARMLIRRDHAPHPERGRVFRAIKKIIPTTDGNHGSRLFVRDDGHVKATPFFLVLLLVELTDVVFAVDSILAIFAITSDPFIVFTSNIFAVMGMRSLYFLLSGMARRFVYLQPGLALVLVFVGLKMAAMEWVKIPVLVSLGVVTLLLGGSVLASLIKTRKKGSAPPPQTNRGLPATPEERPV
jgi:tellurite resistance protein TerC